jgi:ribose-phosphate pyrophosphokinase
MIRMNKKVVDFDVFPNGEINLPLKDLALEDINFIDWGYSDNVDILKLSMLTDYLSSMGKLAELYIKYLPYSRMDRANGHYAVSLKCVARLLNNMPLRSIVVREPHSKVALDLINRSVPDWWCSARIGSTIELCGAGSVFYPDKGAQDRYLQTNKYKYATGSKIRDFDTGDILGMEVAGNIDKSILIVDDMCSRGGTFVGAAKKLKEKGGERIYLLVSYCEDTIFTGEVFNYIDRVFTAKEMLSKSHPQITEIN